jgi:hypothetical protein
MLRRTKLRISLGPKSAHIYVHAGRTWESPESRDGRQLAGSLQSRASFFAWCSFARRSLSRGAAKLHQAKNEAVLHLPLDHHPASGRLRRGYRKLRRIVLGVHL